MGVYAGGLECQRLRLSKCLGVCVLCVLLLLFCIYLFLGRTLLTGYQHLLTTQKLNVIIQILRNINILTRGFLPILSSKTIHIKPKPQNSLYM